MSALNHIANRESIYKLFFCSRYFCGDQNQFMAKFFFYEKMLNLAGSNYHFGKCSVENWLVKELLESSFEDTLSPPISWGFHLLFVCVFTFFKYVTILQNKRVVRDNWLTKTNYENKEIKGECISVNAGILAQVHYYFILVKILLWRKDRVIPLRVVNLFFHFQL